MMRVADDRAQAGKELMESVGGSLEAAYWMVNGRSAFSIADLPDAHAATAVAAVLTHTGAFQNVEVNEILTQEEIAGVLELADSISHMFRVPGQAALDLGDLPTSRQSRQLGAHGIAAPGRPVT
jgi:uncharacterized protein with GYD domain